MILAFLFSCSSTANRNLEADNMFREWEVDVKGVLREGSNELKILFHSPVNTGIEKYDNYPHRLETSDNDLAKIGQVPGEKAMGLERESRRRE